jgi:hypothetical protein
MAKLTRKIKLAAAPAAATFGIASRMTRTAPAVATTALPGVPTLSRSRASVSGRFRSRAIEKATREAAKRFAWRALSIARMAATITSQ